MGRECLEFTFPVSDFYTWLPLPLPSILITESRSPKCCRMGLADNIVFNKRFLKEAAEKNSEPDRDSSLACF